MIQDTQFSRTPECNAKPGGRLDRALEGKWTMTVDGRFGSQSSLAKLLASIRCYVR
jgi:hypothetical protein